MGVNVGVGVLRGGLLNLREVVVGVEQDKVFPKPGLISNPFMPK